MNHRLLWAKEAGKQIISCTDGCRRANSCEVMTFFMKCGDQALFKRHEEKASFHLIYFHWHGLACYPLDRGRKLRWRAIHGSNLYILVNDSSQLADR